MKRKISEIMNDMDYLENFEISEKTQEKLREHFKHEIEREKLEKNKIEYDFTVNGSEEPIEETKKILKETALALDKIFYPRKKK